ncbi:MAG: alpha/beta fold hydrolase [Gammaproteobacteria bacterium]|nr:alpha/beta fold hydrolase [Gammaproteobacteria bacterium]
MAQTRPPVKTVLARQSFRLLGWVAPPLAAAWAYRLWYSTRRFRESEHDKRWRQQAQLQTLDYRHGKIAVYRWGEADRPVVICVHGWNGRASQFATMIPVLLKSGYQVVAFDAPGHGKSQGDSTNIFRISEVLKTVTEPYADVQAIISHSFGGMVVAYAIKHLGLPVQKLVMIASPISTHYLLDMFAQSLSINSRVMAHLERMVRHEFGQDVFEKISAEQNLKNSKLPILLIHDKQDKAVSWRNSERIVAAAGNAVAVYTEGHGHRRLLRDRKLIKKIVQFIKTGMVVA